MHGAPIIKCPNCGCSDIISNKKCYKCLMCSAEFKFTKSKCGLDGTLYEIKDKK